MTDSSSQEKKKKKPRQISHFLFQEMLYDYLTDELDENRKAAIELHMQENKDSEEEKELMDQTLRYCDHLSATRISEPLFQSLLRPSGVEGVIDQIFDGSAWPDSLRWVVQSIVLSVVVAVVALLLPWEELSDLVPGTRDRVLAEKVIAPTQTSAEQQVSEEGLTEDSTNITDVDSMLEGSQEEQNQNSGPRTPQMAPGALVAENQEDDGKVEETKGSTQSSDQAQQKEDSNKPQDKKFKITSAKSDAPKAKVTTVATKEEVTRNTLKGVLFRMFMEHNKIDEVTPKIVNLIESLGGKKAGKVKLGWRKPNGSYFHFSIPEEHKATLLSGLKDFGLIQISEEAHWRVMPEGKIRFILMMKDKNVK
jgi:hypothetical protein